MDPIVYWRAALGLFWAFMFFMLLCLVVGLTFLGKYAFYPLAVFLSVLLLLFLVGFLLFEKRIKAGFVICLTLSSLFVVNQLITLYFLFLDPAGILSSALQVYLTESGYGLFAITISLLLLIWSILLIAFTWKSRYLFEPGPKKQVAWLGKLKETDSSFARGQPQQELPKRQ